MDNAAIIKYTLLLVTAPIWVPFVKALWQELNDALREEGGVFGKELSRDQLDEIRREIEDEEERLVNEPLAHLRAREQAPGAGGGARRGGSSGLRGATTTGGGFKSSGRPRGFR